MGNTTCCGEKDARNPHLNIRGKPIQVDMSDLPHPVTIGLENTVEEVVQALLKLVGVCCLGLVDGVVLVYENTQFRHTQTIRDTGIPDKAKVCLELKAGTFGFNASLRIVRIRDILKNIRDQSQSCLE